MQVFKKNPDINIYLSKLMVSSKGLTIKLDYVYSVALYILIRNTARRMALFIRLFKLYRPPIHKHVFLPK